MRLFIAIEFGDEVKAAICAALDALGAAAERGRLTRRENLHLTLAFLGDVPASGVSRIRAAMRRSSGPCFDLRFDGAGRFKRRGGDIWWLGVRYEAELYALEARLASNLRAEGFELEQRQFTPHLTLGREMRLPPDFDGDRLPAVEPAQSVTGITLFKSERISGVLTYTGICTTTLKMK